MNRSRAFRVALTVLLVSCGGGRQDGAEQAQRNPFSHAEVAAVDPSFCRPDRPHAASLIRHHVIDGACVRRFAGLDAASASTTTQHPRRRALAATAAPRTPTPDELFDWAERTYPQFFPTHQPTLTFPPYAYRHYPQTGNYAAVANGIAYVLGPISNNEMLEVGRVETFACQVFPADCQPEARRCQVTSWEVGGLTCTPNSGQKLELESGDSVSYVDALGATHGSATFTCTDGSLAVKGQAVCDAVPERACNTPRQAWTAGGRSCTANVGEPEQISSGRSHTFSASTSLLGQATFTCTDGVLSAPANASCAQPAAQPCRPTFALSWAEGLNACSPDVLPEQIAVGGRFGMTDSTGGTTGEAAVLCTTRGLEIDLINATCGAQARVQDSFGGDGGDAGGADGTAGDGAPIAGGLVTVTDRNGRKAYGTTQANGYFRVRTPGFEAPIVVSVARPDGVVRHSLSTQPLVPNRYAFVAVTGLSDKIASDIARAAGYPGASGLTPAIIASNPSALDSALAAMRTDPGISPLLRGAGIDPARFDPLTTPFRADGTGYDRVLDNLVIGTDDKGTTVVTTLDCPLPASWSVGSATCAPDPDQPAVVQSGTTRVIADSIGSTEGFANWSCNKGALELKQRACNVRRPAASCTAPSAWSDGAASCSPDGGQPTQIASGTSVKHVDTAGATTGSVTWSCLDGTLAPPSSLVCRQTATSCAVPASWKVGNATCSPDPGQPAAIASGESEIIRDSTGNATGAAQWSCSNGTLQPPTAMNCTIAASCTLPTSWKAGDASCTPDPGQATTLASGERLTHQDSSMPTTGSITWTCHDGTAAPAAAGTCATACTAPTSWTVGGSACAPDFGQPVIVASGSTLTLRDTQAPTTGVLTAQCSQGQLSDIEPPSCSTAAVPCETADIVANGWTVGGQTCKPDSAPASVASGASLALADATGPTTGTMNAQCVNGTLLTVGDPSCSSSAAKACDTAAVASAGWTVGTANCRPDSVPASVASGQMLHLVDSQEPNTGGVSLQCNDGALNQVGQSSCAAGSPPPQGCSTASLAANGWTVGANTCMPDSLPGSVAHGATLDLTDSQQPTTGAISLSCGNGTLSTTGSPTCNASGPAACDISYLPTTGWTANGYTCRAWTFDQTIASGTQRTFTDTYEPETGTITLQCTDGTLTPVGTPSCTLQAGACNVDALAASGWTAGGPTCFPDTRNGWDEKWAPSGARIQWTDINSAPYGFLDAECVSGTLVPVGSNTFCSPTKPACGNILWGDGEGNFCEADDYGPPFLPDTTRNWVDSIGPTTGSLTLTCRMGPLWDWVDWSCTTVPEGRRKSNAVRRSILAADPAPQAAPIKPPPFVYRRIGERPAADRP
ncbi:hypothetical protein [Aquabacterium humicola]|uniref:hypothetical protein n=1 Tax=Aquabacterium humicola TaxID=3237377 RepID=UPI0025434616|nr:hypothetical protein [Rubrivivax pictus]